jgi:hypothetical protein
MLVMIHTIVIRATASFVAHALLCLLPRALAIDVHSSQLQSAVKQPEILSSRYAILVDSLEAYLRGRGLLNADLSWKRDCSQACYNNAGTCNLISGTCTCPIGRVHSDAGTASGLSWDSWLGGTARCSTTLLQVRTAPWTNWRDVPWEV